MPRVPPETREVQLLVAILEELQSINSGQSLVIARLRDISTTLDELIPEPEQVTSFTVTQTGDSTMGTPPVTPILAQPDPGATLQFTATPTPAGSALPAGVVPTWTSSDTANVTITTDPTGLIATVVLGAAIPVGEVVTLTVTATLPDGTTPTGTAQFTVGAAPPVEVTGFAVIQTA